MSNMTKVPDKVRASDRMVSRTPGTPGAPGTPEVMTEAPETPETPDRDLGVGSAAGREPPTGDLGAGAGVPLGEPELGFPVVFETSAGTLALSDVQSVQCYQKGLDRVCQVVLRGGAVVLVDHQYSRKLMGAVRAFQEATALLRWASGWTEGRRDS